MAAGKPAAEGTGRHHNVREDIGLIAREPEKRPLRSSRCLSNTPNLNEFLTGPIYSSPPRTLAHDRAVRIDHRLWESRFQRVTIRHIK
jgi:hypothetical protein